VKELGAQEVQTGDCPRRIESLLLFDPDRTLLQSITEWILPESVNGITAMKEFIRWDVFQTFRLDSGDLKAVDLIFQKGLRISGGDIDMALFICFVGTIDHAKIGIRVPLLGLTLYVPLTTESGQNFQKRYHHLPSHFYSDSPAGTYGDRDKLQHFFGSAYLAYMSGSGAYTRILGIWIEILEQKYIVDGADDPRDRRANLQGVLFGKMLLKGKDILPGNVLNDSGDHKNESY
jgi:hypothetical protein